MYEAEKILKTGLIRKPGYMYFLDKDLNICCAPMHPKHMKNPKKRIVVATPVLKRESRYIYRIDSDGDLARRRLPKEMMYDSSK